MNSHDQYFKDLFSSQSNDYARFRPRYPKSLFEYLASLTPEKKKVWDCGTGNGQAAIELAQFFESVIATDPSEKQITQATAHPKITYQLAPAERAPLADQSVDLITVAQAFHWFKPDLFFQEVRRVLKPEGALAIWCYSLCKVDNVIDQAVHELYEGVLGSYWEPERRLVEEGYKNCSFPFQELKPPFIEMTALWIVDQMLGYFGTWSALQSYIKKNGKNPLEEHAPKIRKAWGSQNQKLAKFGFHLRVGRLTP